MKYSNCFSSAVCAFFIIINHQAVHAQDASLLSSVAYNLVGQAATVWDQVRTKLAAGKSVGFAELPGLSAIAIHPGIKELLNKAQINAPWLEVYESGVALKGSIDLFGASINTMLFFATDVPGHVSFYITIPNVVKFASVAPVLSFFDSLSPRYTIFALSLTEYQFKELDLTVEQGLNAFTCIVLADPLAKIAQHLGTRLNELELYGLFHPAITGSSLTAALPGSFKFQGIETTGLALRVAIEEAGLETRVPSLSIVTGFNVTWPQVFKTKQHFQGAIKITPQQGEIWGSMQGGIELPSLPGAHVVLEEARLTAAVDWGALAASSGAVPITGAGFQGKIVLNPNQKDAKKTFEAAVKAAYSSAGLGDFILMGSMAGVLTLEELVDFGALQILEASRAVGKPVDLKPLYQDKVPVVAVKDPFLEIVPKRVFLADKYYDQKIAFGGMMQILDTAGKVSFSLSLDGLKGLGYLDAVKIGPLEISGYLPTEPGARIEFRLDLAQQHFYLSGRLKLNILGGISSESIITLLPRGLVCKLTTKLFDKYEADMEIAADVLQSISANNFFIKARMKQELLSFLQEAMTKFARSLTPDFDAKAQSEMDRVAGEIDRLEQEKNTEYGHCMGPAWNWSHERCTLFWGEIVKRNVALGGLHTYRDTILKPGVSIARGAVGAFADITSFAGTVLGSGINIESFEFEGKLSEFVQEAKLPRVSMRIKFLGQERELKNIQFSFLDIPGSVSHVFAEMQKLFS